MSDFDRRLYDVLTSDTETGARLNYEMFGDNEWSGVDRAEYLERLRDRIDAEKKYWGEYRAIENEKWENEFQYRETAQLH